jgi:hypothetical protein
MSGTYLTQLATWLRAVGLTVVEVDGWQRRARSSGGYAAGQPSCIMWHHTASQTTPQNDVSFIVNASDGPLSNLYLARDGSVWVIAAGATNTNGKGGPLTVSRGTIPVDGMNTRAVGIEAANSGLGEQWPAVQIDAFFALSNCLCANLGLLPSDLASHAAWAPGRKIDPATAPAVQGAWRPRSINSSGTWNLDDIRSEAIARADNAIGPSPEPTPEGDDMEVVQIRVAGSNASFLGYRVKQQTDAPRVFILWAEWVNGTDPNQLARFETYQAMGVPVHDMAIDDMRGVGLIGPVPTGDGLRQWTRSDFGNVITG